MRNYQAKKNNPYILPHSVYMQALYAIRDYDRLKALCTNGAPKYLLQKKKAIDTALETLPKFYRKPIWNNIQSGARYPLGADVRTFQTHKQRFVFQTAKNLKIL